jgi:predicted N-acetyltransferase YhbS
VQPCALSHSSAQVSSALPNDPDASPPQVGWVDAIAVLGNHQRQGMGSALLTWAEEWLSAQGCTRFRLGGSLRPFVPGPPVELGNVAYFQKRGYAERIAGEQTWDVARDLRDYEPRAVSAGVLVGAGVELLHQHQIRSARPGDEDALLDFLLREFPNRWRYEFQEFLRQNGRISDYMILLTERGVDGFAHLTFEDSLYPMDRFYVHRLPRPWGQLGPIGVSADTRGKGYGAALLDAGLRHLRDKGVRGCVIDWTGLVDFYGRFGFKPYRRYAMLMKSIG